MSAQALRPDVDRLRIGQASAEYSEDGNRCAWCDGPIPAGKRRDSKFCGTPHRQAAFRFGVRASGLDAAERPMRFAYADPPYPGKAGYYPENEEVDHARLVEQLVDGYPDGWALSTSSAALRDVLALCPPEVRVCAWYKGPRPTKSRRALTSWEPVLVWRGRPLDASVVQDLVDGFLVEDAADPTLPQRWIDGLVARGRFRAFPGALVGMKPPAFAEWLFRQLGARPGDELFDMFPGSGAVTKAWEMYVRDPDDASPLERTDAA